MAMRVNQRVSLLMITAFFFGASIGFYTKYLFVVHQNLGFSFLAGSIMGIGILWFGSLLSRERREIYMACLVFSYALMYSSFVVNALDVLDSHIAHWVLEVYLTLFFAMWSFTSGSFSHWIWEAGGGFTILSSVASLLCLYFISPLRVRTRVLLLMIAAFSIGASIGIFTKYFFEIDQELVCRLLAPPTLGIGIIWFGSTFTRERGAIYMGCLFYSSLLFFSTFNASNSEYIDSHTAHRMLKVCIVFALFMGYVVVYSQEILYDAQFGEINFVNRTLTVFFRLPGILVHAARLCLGA